MKPASPHFSTRLSGFCLVIAPLLFGTSTFYWKSGEYGITGGTILALSLVFWVLSFVALFDELKHKMPYYAPIGLLLAIYGCISGVCFAFVGIFSEAFHIPHNVYLQAAAEHSLSFNLILFWPGPLFPLSLLVLGINLMRKKRIPAWTGVLICLGGIAFPVSRISRVAWVAHTADLLLVIPFVLIGLRYISTPQRRQEPAHR